ncbi:MAG TPA: membrane protein insertase YidC [Gemmatimonadales bacterium]|nr:membrane protein insertase YidC [Gemmatimonadales bacterium]
MDRRTVWAILIMMVIAIAPALLIKRSPTGGVNAPHTTARDSAGRVDSLAPAPAGPAAAADSVRPAAAPTPAGPTASAAAEDTVAVTSPLYVYGVSTLGARLVSAELLRYASMAPAEKGRQAQILPPGGDLLGLTLVAGRDTVSFDRVPFTVSATRLAVSGPTPLRLSATRGGVGVELTYTFHPDDYRVDVAGRLSGVGPNGGQLLVGLGPTLANTEANLDENHRDLALVTRGSDVDRNDLAKLDPAEPATLSGPFQWAALKSKYFVTGLLAGDTVGGISGATATALPDPAGKKPTAARIRVSLPVSPAGDFRYTVYAGPMEYDRLARQGHAFDDVNPYGYPGLRTLIRLFAVPVRWLLVWMHEHLLLSYGVVLIVFGLLVRVLLWPLNQKAMRANMKMQEVQPLMKDIQERHKEDPQRMQQEMFKLYKEHGVNPLGGCWPMLLPMPILFALFFVFQNAIELRGTAFLWIPDLSRPDPLYVIPLLMGISMFVLTKVGQVGMEPNPQMKTMLYLMPVMMTGMFLFFPSGLNLYYTVSKIASIPQQWMLARERQRRTARVIVDVKTDRPPESAAGGRRKRG